MTDQIPPSYRALADMLDDLDVALCLFDGEDRALLWNRTFLRFFPEHDGQVHAGEAYADNLRRFYRKRLPPESLHEIDRYIADGVARHRAQTRPFTFQHDGQWLRVASLPTPEGGRVRSWTRVPGPQETTVLAPSAPLGFPAESMLEQVADGIVIFDPDGTVSFASERFLALYGIASRQGATGRCYPQLLAQAWENTAASPEEGQRLDAALARVAENQTFTGAPFEVPLPGGRWVRVTEHRAANGTVYSTHSDITNLRRQQEAISSARDAADRANAAKSAFLAMMSHEIRTPMNGIIGMSSLLLDGALDESKRDYATALHRSAQALLVILNDILDLSRLEAAKLTLEDIEFDLPALVEELVQLVGPSASGKGLRLTLEREPGLPARFCGDPTRLRQIILNFLSNAVKFTETGGICIRLGAAAPPRTVRIEVVDTGIGLEESSLERLFESFEQADATIARRFGGTGLGLSIARRLVELMGGRIGAARRPEGGSLFWCELPLRPLPPLVQARAEPVAGAAGGVAGGRVLLVEDNLTNQAVARAVLERGGFEVRVAGTGAAALDVARLSRPDIILLDIQLPDMDGVEVARRIQAEGAAPGVPIIALTANAMAGDRDRFIEAGMNDYLAKPYTMQELLARVCRWIRR